jgi:hypothetical protein
LKFDQRIGRRRIFGKRDATGASDRGQHHHRPDGGH